MVWCCPKCRSRNYKVKEGSHAKGTKCFDCGFETAPAPLSISSGTAQPTSDRNALDTTIEESVKPSKTIEKNELFHRISDFHDIAYKFKVFNGRVDWPRQIGFRNIQRSVFEGHKVAMSSDGWLIIFKSGRNKIPTIFLPEIERVKKEELSRLAVEIASKYNLTIDARPIHFSSGKPEVKTPFLWEGNFTEPGAKSVYSKPNYPGPLELTGAQAVPNTMNLTQALIMLNENTLLEIYNKQLHQRVLKHMDKTLSKIEEKVSIPTPQGVTDKKDNWVGLWSAVLERTKPLLHKLEEAFA